MERYRYRISQACLLHEHEKSVSAAHGNYPAKLAGWVSMCLACEQRFTTRGVLTTHGTKLTGAMSVIHR